MGNVQFIQGINPFDNTDSDTFSPDSSEAFDFDSDSFMQGNITSLSDQNTKIVCEYCQEYFFAQFHEQHVRICDCNPINLRVNREFQSRGEGYTIQSSSSSNPELQKIPCEFCNELCYLKYQNDHQRICPKNPENIKINCRYCSRTLNLILYQSHLECCEDNYRRERRSSVEPEPRGMNARPSLLHMRKVKTNTDIEMDCCKGVKRGGLDKDKQVDCPICLETISSTFDLTVLRCNHKFHRHCLNNWSMRQRKCPMCRKEFL